ncbi:MAG: hypothetical protein EOP83_11815 [Verrucomicrobiaceae bacterium]|nr:MAG: hypothetical protein EOP83_11815 [Verrucomicrobiaceae bacterium]
MKRNPWTTEAQRHEQRYRNNRAVGAKYGLPSRSRHKKFEFIIADTTVLYRADLEARYEWLKTTPGLTGWYKRGVHNNAPYYASYLSGNCFEFTDQNTAFMYKLHWC